MAKKRTIEPTKTSNHEGLSRRAAIKRLAAGLAGAGMAALPAGRAFAKGGLPDAASPRLDALTFDELGRVVLPEGHSLSVDSDRRIAAGDTNVLCTTPGCACPPALSTCPANLFCGDCPKPPPAPLPECYCPPSNSTCTRKSE